MARARSVDTPVRSHVAVSAFAAVVAFSAYAGALGLATGALDMGSTLDRRLPLDSPVLAGLALALVVGVPATVVAATWWRGDPRAPRAAIGAGALLVGWILVEIAFIREFSFLQPLFIGVGIAFVAIGRRARDRECA